MEAIRIMTDTTRKNYLIPATVTQNDNGREIIIKIQQDGRDEVLDENVTYTMMSKRKDGIVVMSSEGVLTGYNEITFTLGSKEIEIVGQVEASVQMYKEGVRLSSMTFKYNVEKDLAVNYVPTENEATLIELVLVDAPTIIQDTKDATEEALLAAEIARNANSENTIIKSNVEPTGTVMFWLDTSMD